MAPWKDRTARDGDGGIFEKFDHTLRPTLREADPVVEERENPTARLCGGEVETVTTRGRVVRNHCHAVRSVRPCLSRGHDELALSVTDHLQHVAERPSRAVVHGVDCDDQAERRRLIEGPRVILCVG